MPAKVNLVGRRFGRLTVLKESHADKHRHYHWLCVCDCGTEKTINGEVLKRGESTSCGCIGRERMRELGKKCKHGHASTRLYKIYKGIKNRCYNQRDLSYKNYGAKQILMCDEWLNFESFYEWSRKNGYAENLTIDRIDNAQGYCPENCRWVTSTQQGQNRSPCLKVDDVMEIKKMLCDRVDVRLICKKYKRSASTINRIKNNKAWRNI